MNFSKQRETILKYLINSKEHPTAEKIYLDLKSTLPNLSLATVYRNCNVLVDSGQVMRLTATDKVDRFDADISEHQHFVCTSCQQVSDLYFKLSEDNINKNLSDGYKADSYQIYIYGICDKCQKN